MIRKWKIYKLTSPSGRIYVGKTVDLKKRMGDYRRLQCKNQKLLYKSLVKYGYDNHACEVIDEFESDFDFACGKEIFWIRTNMSNIRKFKEINGLNLSDGGDGNLGLKHTEETKKKLSDFNKANPSMSMLGKKLSLEARAKISKANKGKPNWRKGKFSEEIRLRNEAWKNREKWATLKGVIPHKAIAASIIANTGRIPYNKGVKSTLSKEERKEFYGKRNVGNKYNLGTKWTQEMSENASKSHKKAISQFSLDGTFIQDYPSIKEAAPLVGMSSVCIGKILKGRVANPKKFIFKYK